MFGDVEAESTIKFGEYQHVVCTYDGLTVSLYVDGELVGTSGAQIGDIAYPPEDYSAKHSSALLTLGANHDANDYFTMHGELDEAMIFAIPSSPAMNDCSIVVSVEPGSTALTRMPCRAYSCAAAFVRPTTPCFAAV